MRITTDMETRISNPMDVAEGARPVYYGTRTGRLVSRGSAVEAQFQRQEFQDTVAEIVRRHQDRMVTFNFEKTWMKMYGKKKTNEEGQYELDLDKNALV